MVVWYTTRLNVKLNVAATQTLDMLVGMVKSFNVPESKLFSRNDC